MRWHVLFSISASLSITAASVAAPPKRTLDENRSQFFNSVVNHKVDHFAWNFKGDPPKFFKDLPLFLDDGDWKTQYKHLLRHEDSGDKFYTPSKAGTYLSAMIAFPSSMPGDVWRVTEKGEPTIIMVYLGEAEFSDLPKRKFSFFGYPWRSRLEINTFPPRWHMQLWEFQQAKRGNLQRITDWFKGKDKPKFVEDQVLNTKVKSRGQWKWMTAGVGKAKKSLWTRPAIWTKKPRFEAFRPLGGFNKDNLTEGATNPEPRAATKKELEELQKDAVLAEKYIKKCIAILEKLPSNPKNWDKVWEIFSGEVTVIVGSSSNKFQWSQDKIKIRDFLVKNYKTMLGALQSGAITFKVQDSEIEGTEGGQPIKAFAYTEFGATYITFSKTRHFKRPSADRAGTMIHELAHLSWGAGHAYQSDAVGAGNSLNFEPVGVDKAVQGADRYQRFAILINTGN